MNDFVILISVFIILFITLHTAIYFYIKRERRKFFSYIQNRRYILIEKVDTDIETSSKINYKFMYRKSDIVFLDQEIFILAWNKQTIQIRTSLEIFPGVSQSLSYSSKVKMNDRLEIKGNLHQGFIQGDYKIVLNFKGKNFDLNSIIS